MICQPATCLHKSLFPPGRISWFRMASRGSSAGPSSTPRNRLSSEKSPYLLQHATNPVDWYPWGQDAFDKAKSESKPIFLSVGYSTCHWCHVMERESFENESIAKILNENFVSVKVDREERPDVDKVYMTFVQATQGGGGWPMSVFLTPGLKPFMGGTYFPPNDSYGRPGFATILKTISEQWKSKRGAMEEQGSKIMELLAKDLESEPDSGMPGTGCIQRGYEMLEKRFDETHGGFGKAPKFPQPTILDFLLSMYARYPNSAMGERALDMTLFTLTAMAKGGMHDHVGQGFHRYSTDKFWHVPHFEKMLYDQGQLACIYANAYQITKDAYFKDVLEDILFYVSRDLTDKDGGFYSAEDADSYPTAQDKHKKEGAFCVWIQTEISSLLTQPISPGSEHTAGNLFCYHYGVQEKGNVEPHQDPHNELTGKNVLIVRGSLEKSAEHFKIDESKAAELLKESRELLYKQRLGRPKPHRDDKILTSWNGLMISGFSCAFKVVGDVSYLEAAKKAATFVKNTLYDKEKGTLRRNAYRDSQGDLGKSIIEGFADDYAFMIEGLLDLFEASQEGEWLEWACLLQQKMVELFWDQSKGGFFSTTASDPSILLRMKEEQDGAEPSANSCSALNLQRLSAYFPGKAIGPKTIEIYKVFGKMLSEHPVALPKMVSAFMFNSQTPKQIIIAGEPGSDDTAALLDAVNSLYLPNKIIIVHKPDTDSILTECLDVLASVVMVDGRATAYLCENYKCVAPITDPVKLKRTLNPKHQV